LTDVDFSPDSTNDDVGPNSINVAPKLINDVGDVASLCLIRSV